MKIVIAGAGPAGISCAVQLKRYGLEPLLIEKDQPGGLLHDAGWIFNFPGFPGGIAAKELISRLQRHLEIYDIEVIGEKVFEVRHEKEQFRIKTSSETMTADLFVHAGGTVPVKPPFDLPRIHTGVRELRHVKRKRIGIIGAGDAAFDYALQLAENHVQLFNRSNRIRAIKRLTDSVMAHPAIEYHKDHLLEQADEADGKFLLQFRKGGERINYSFDHIIFAIGRVPAGGFIHIEPDRSRALQKAGSLHYIGDVINGNYRQASVACGDGVRTAMIIYDKVRSAGY